MEFKTSEFDIDTPDQIWNFAPQDIEQLLFYTALWTHDNDTHYLIYMSENDPDCLRVFKVEITDSAEIRRELESRKSTLTEALEEENSEILGRCRYHNHSCQIEENDICDCDSLDHHPTDNLREATIIERDESLEERIRISLRANEDIWGSLGSWDLYTPRQWYLRETQQQTRTDSYTRPQWVDAALSSAGLTPGPFVDLDYPRMDGVVEYSPDIKFVRRNRTVGQESESEWVPAKIIAKDWYTAPDADRLRNQFMQIACAAAVSDRDRGLVIVELPEAGTEVDAHEIQLEDIEGIQEKIRDRLDLISTALQSDNPSLLPECVDWVQDYECENCLCDN